MRASAQVALSPSTPRHARAEPLRTATVRNQISRLARERLILGGLARAPGMGFEEVRLENIGPIRKAAIGRHRVSVFVGPNNSGKSVAARIIHGACRMGLQAGVEIRIPADDRPCGEGGAGEAAAADAALSESLIRCAGMERGDMVSNSADSARIALACGAVGDSATDAGHVAGPGAALPAAPAGGAAKGSIYVPAGRAGAVPYILAGAQADGARSAAAAFPAGQASGARVPSGPPSRTVRRASGRRAPEHLGPFCEVVLEAFTGGLGTDAMSTFSRLFGGSIEPCAPGALPAVRYRDPSGAAVDIASAGSGIAAALPVVAAVHRTEPGGTLIVEEPEADMEAMGQLRLANEIVRVAQRRGVLLVLVTHSDFVVHAILDMVRDGAVDSGDLGLYYFRRMRGSYTEVERVHVNGEGEAELELFNEAIDALACGSVVRDAS